MELGIETKVEGTILEKGKIALDAKLFSEIIRKFSSPDAIITIESDRMLNTTISSENSVFNNIQGKDGDEFSYLPYIEKRPSNYFIPVYVKGNHPPDAVLHLPQRQQ